MAKKKSRNPFVKLRPYLLGLFFASVYVTLVVTSNISFEILESSNSICLDECNQLTIDVELCRTQCGQTIGRLEQDTDFFSNLQRFKQNPTPSTFPYFNLTPESILWVMGLFVVGFVLGWLTILIFNKKK